MRLAFIAIGLLAGITLARADVVPPPPDPWSVMDIMTGHWRMEKDGAVNEEVWLAPSGNMLVGMNREVKGLEVFFEYLRIENRKDGIVYIASPRGGDSATFKLTHSTNNELVFENPTHDWPQKITYRRTGDTSLDATVTGSNKGKSWTQNFRWTLIK